MTFYDIKALGKDSNGNTIVYGLVEVDTETDFPAATAYQSDGWILAQGFRGHTIDTNGHYMLDSSGSWVLQDGGTASYTKAEVDTLLAAKQNTLTFDSTPTSGSTNPVTSGGIYTAIADFLTFDKIYGLAVRLPDTGIDSNNYTTPGVFRMQTATGAGLSSNIPMTTAAFKMIVEYVNSETRIRQTFIPLAAQGYYFIRMYTNLGWQPWYKFEGVQV